MDKDLYGFAFVAVVAVALPLIFYGIRRKYESKRAESLESVARSLGMSFEHGRDIDATERFGAFRLFSHGHGKKVSNCMSGMIDSIDVTTFGYEYNYEDEDGADMPTRQTVFLFRSNELSLPWFELSPTPQKIFGIDVSGKRTDIVFDSRPKFSKLFYLSGDDEPAIRHLFSRSVLEYFESHEGLSVEGQDGLMLCYFGRTRLRPHEIKHFVKWVKPVLDLFRIKP